MNNNENLNAQVTERPQLPLEKSPGQRILVVDDEPMICRLNSEVLRDAGYQVETAGDGEAAWELLNMRNYDLLLTDNDMPKVTGVELLKRLHEARRSLPTIMATATHPHQEFMQHLWLQSVVTLLKPYYIAELLEQVRSVLLDTMVSGEYPTHWVPATKPIPVHSRYSSRHVRPAD